MATKVAVGDKFQVTFVCRFGGQNGLNVKYFKVDAVSNMDGLANEFAQKLSTVFAPLYKPLLSTAAKYRGVMMKQVGTLLPISYFATDGTGDGTATGDPLPSQACGLISLYGQGEKRKNHGRVYIPFPAEGDNASNGGVSVAYGANADLLGQEFLNNRTYNIGGTDTDITGRWYIASSQGGGTPCFLESKRVRGFWASQRRRGLLGRSDLVIV
jgi:hypothetical protein